jgi:hypothetical protein
VSRLTWDLDRDGHRRHEDGMNMSWRVHHASYGGSGGGDDTHGYVNMPH